MFAGERMYVNVCLSVCYSDRIKRGSDPNSELSFLLSPFYFICIPTDNLNNYSTAVEQRNKYCCNLNVSDISDSMLHMYLLFSGHSVRLLGQKKDGGRRLGGARLDLPKIRKNPLIEIISINTG